MNEQQLSDLWNFASEFSKIKEEEQKKLPFHLNLVDQLHINENAHSRILMHLLSYTNENGKYVFLTSLIDLIKERLSGDFGKITIESPKITQEKERIDLWVMDKNYAIIFENKIYNADDREAQLSNYIGKTLKHDYNKNQIFVVYLSQYPKEPEPQSWGEYKDSFRSRYVNLSYCYDILPWLKDKVMPCIECKEQFLQSAIIQYIDYLEGLFKIRNIDEPMNKELQKLIIKQFDLSEKSDKECISFLREKSDSINEVSQQMNKMIEDYRKNIYETWKKKTAEKYSKLEPNKVSEGSGKGWVITDVTFDNIDGIRGKRAVVSIGCDGAQFYSGFYFDFNLPVQDRELIGSTVERLKKPHHDDLNQQEHLPHSNDRKEMYKSFDIEQFDEVYQHFEETIAIVKDNDN